jgi:hypothetical protein
VTKVIGDPSDKLTFTDLFLSSDAEPVPTLSKETTGSSKKVVN